jgi:nicotinate-nucleotide adenylyltransferase
MRIGLLGGSFNPIHNGHLQIALRVKQQMNLDRVVLLPTGCHPLKPQAELLNGKIRYALVEKAIAGIDGLAVSNLDLEHDIPNYTDILIQKLQKQYPDDIFYFIIGADNVSQLPRWHNWEWLLKNVQFIVVNRPDCNVSELHKLPYFSALHMVEIEPIPISATEIRKRMKAHLSIAHLVPPAVEADIVSAYSSFC